MCAPAGGHASVIFKEKISQKTSEERKEFPRFLDGDYNLEVKNSLHFHNFRASEGKRPRPGSVTLNLGCYTQTCLHAFSSWDPFSSEAPRKSSHLELTYSLQKYHLPSGDCPHLRMKWPHRLMCWNTGSPAGGAVCKVVELLKRGTYLAQGSRQGWAVGSVWAGPLTPPPALCFSVRRNEHVTSCCRHWAFPGILN